MHAGYASPSAACARGTTMLALSIATSLGTLVGSQDIGYEIMGPWGCNLHQIKFLGHGQLDNPCKGHTSKATPLMQDEI